MHNPKIYESGGFGELGELGFVGSWLDWFLLETESFHGKWFTRTILQTHLRPSKGKEIHRVEAVYLGNSFILTRT